MLVSQPNNVKVYNLSSGKSLPEWLSERKRRELQKQDIDVRRRIELVQDFSMPTAATSIQVTRDEQYIIAAGVYKPMIRCYDVNQLSQKFERCFDSDVIKMELLSDDCSKLALLQNDRYIEFHAVYGRYYRTRMPNFGRDLAYHAPSCDLYLVGTGPEIFRLNLEQGRYLQPYETEASQINVCELNPVHLLLAVGTEDGKVICFDPRSKKKVGEINLNMIHGNFDPHNSHSVTALAFRGSLQMGIGLSSGQVLLYDIRAREPFIIKDHYNELPICKVAFHTPSDTVLSADSKVIKIWNRNEGDIFTSIEPDAAVNDFCQFGDSGLILTANETEKMGVYYIPSLGQAPKWCSFLDNLTEELEESDETIIYDDYKFVTNSDLEGLGLTHLIGTNFLRAYMHGYFIDVRLYNKAKLIAEPFAYEQYRKNRIRQKIEEERTSRIKLSKLPKVNKELAERLLDVDGEEVTAKAESDYSNPLKDDRFAAIFSNPDFQIDEESEEFRLLHPVVSKKEKERKQRLRDSSLLPDLELGDEQSSDEDSTWNTMKLKKKALKKKKREEDMPKLYEIEEGQEFKLLADKNPKKTVSMSVSLGELVDKTEDHSLLRADDKSVGGKEVSFKIKRSEKEEHHQEQIREHVRERKKVRRSTGGLVGKGKKKWKF